MKTIISLLIPMVLLIFPFMVSAQEQPYKDPNAAIRYLMAIGFMPALTGEDEKAIAEVVDIETFNRLSPSLKGKAGEATSFRIKKLLQDAAKCTECNFMPDQKFDPQDIVPPYRKMRTFARFLTTGAWKAIQGGQHVEGAELLVSVFRFGDDFENYGPMISYMIGHAIRNIAVQSMKNLISLDCKPEAKKIIIDYLKSLPKPAFPLTEAMAWEKKFSGRMFEILGKDAKSLVELLKQTEDSSTESQKSSSSSCVANQRVLMGAMEMLLMDKVDLGNSADSATIIAKLVKDQYLKISPECPLKGNYQVELSGNDVKVSCSCGADPNSSTPVEKKPEPSEDPELLARATEYHSSGKFSRDMSEYFELYEKMMALNTQQKDGFEKVKALQDDYFARKNILIDHAFPNFHKAVQLQLKLQEDIESLLK